MPRRLKGVAPSGRFLKRRNISRQVVTTGEFPRQNEAGKAPNNEEPQLSLRKAISLNTGPVDDLGCFNGSLNEDDELDNQQSVGSVLSDKVSPEEVLYVGMVSKSDTVSSEDDDTRFNGDEHVTLDGMVGSDVVMVRRRPKKVFSLDHWQNLLPVLVESGIF